MSDCGTLLTVSRQGGALPEDTVERVKAFAAAREAEGTFADGMGNPFSFKVSRSASEDGSPGVAVTLSEYWVEDDDQMEFVEDMLDMDREVAEELRVALGSHLGDGFSVELYAGEW